MVRLSVAVDTPQHAQLGALLDYECDQDLPPGTLVRVPLVISLGAQGWAHPLAGPNPFAAG